MLTHRQTAQVQPDGSIVLGSVPFPPGATVEISVSEQATAKPTDSERYPYHGIPVTLIDPFKPAVSAEDWDVYR